MKDVPENITERQIDLFRQVHPDYSAGVCAALDALDPQF
jgi:catalase